MTPEQLKNSILQYAIQGKLVEQRASEESAEKLYKKIQAEKEKLIAEGKIKKQKELPKITKEEIPFEIPKNWKWVRLGDCMLNKSGVSYNKKNLEIYSNKMIRLLRGGNIADMKFNFKDDDIMISSEFVKEDLFLQKNMLITPAVTSLEHIGKMARINENYKNTVVGGFVLMLIPYLSNDILSKYLLYTFSSFYFRNNCKMITNKSGHAFYNLSRIKLMELILPLPPLAEQKRIVEKIEELLPLVEDYAKAYTELKKLNAEFPEKMKKSILDYAIQGKLVEQKASEESAEKLYKKIQAEKEKLIAEGKIKKQKELPKITKEEIPFAIPKNWKWVRLGEVIQVENGDRGKNYPSKDKLLREGDIPFISAINIKDKTISKDNLLYLSKKQYDLLRSGNLEKDDLVLCIRGSLGKNCIYPFKKGAIASSLVIVKNFINEKIFALYISLYFDTILFEKEIDNYNNGTAQPNLGSRDLIKFLLPLPPLAEQKRIVEKIEELLSYCEMLK